MPNIKSASKRLRQNKKRRTKNFAIKAKIKQIGKGIEKNLAANQKEEAKKELNLYFKAVDKAVVRGILKKNTGARKKSNFARALFSKKTAPSKEPKDKAPSASTEASQTKTDD